MNTMQTLLCEYKQSLRELRNMKRNIESLAAGMTDEQLKQDKSLINGMIDEMQFAIQWMETGRNPNAYRGADRGGVYLLEPTILEAVIANPKPAAPGRELTEEEKFMIEDALADLTNREKEVFILIKAEKFTYDQTAELLGISKSSIQTYMERAERKVIGQKQGSLFLVG